MEPTSHLDSYIRTLQFEFYKDNESRTIKTFENNNYPTFNSINSFLYNNNT